MTENGSKETLSAIQVNMIVAAVLGVNDIDICINGK